MNKLTGITRRRLLAASGAGLGLALFPSARLLAKEQLTPRRGGVVRAAFSGKSAAPLDVFSASLSPLAYVRGRLIWDALAEFSEGVIQYRLMESLEADKTASRWHIKLRKGIHFSDGTPLTSKEVLYSLQQLASHPSLQSAMLTPVDFAASAVDDKWSLTLQLKQPVGAFDLRLATSMFVFPPHDHKVGSGAWLMESCNANFCSFMPRKDYWDQDQLPLVDEIRLYGIDDMGARVNGLKAGQFDYAGGVPLSYAVSERNNPAIKVVLADKAEWGSLGFIMNIHQPPFDKPEVVQALKLSIDREVMVKTLTYGMGEVANDMWGGGQIWFNNDLPVPPYDPEKARALLKKAGVETPRSAIRTSNFEWGMVEGSTLLLRQAKPAGFDLTVNKVPVSDLYGDLPTLAKAPIKCLRYDLGTLPVKLLSYYGHNASWPFSGLDTPQLEQLLQTLLRAQGDAVTPAVHDVQDYIYHYGGDAFFARIPSMALSSPNLHGVAADGLFDYPSLRAAWLAS